MSDGGIDVLEEEEMLVGNCEPSRGGNGYQWGWGWRGRKTRRATGMKDKSKSCCEYDQTCIRREELIRETLNAKALFK